MVEANSQRTLKALLLNIVVALGGIIMVTPLVWMVSASFKPLNEIYAYPPSIIPNGFTTANYTRLLTEYPFLNWYANSLLVAIIQTLAVLFFTSLAGYAFAKYRFRGSKFLFVLLLITAILGLTDIFPFVKKPARR